MANRHKDTLNHSRFDLADFFCNPRSPRHKQYEAVRAIVQDHLPVTEAAQRFGYESSTMYSLLRDAKAGRLELFPTVPRGPRQKHTAGEVQQKMIALRRQGLSTEDIHLRLLEQGIPVSARTVERILKDQGFSKLNRRTHAQLGRTSKNTLLPERSEHLDFSNLEPFSADCPAAGIFLFLPYILETGILDIVKECRLPESSAIGCVQASLSMLALKLIGANRLSHIGAYDREPALGIFAGLNVLPKPTYICTYSCRCSASMLLDLQNKVITALRERYPDFYSGEFINLDFHSIPHFGDESAMERLWCGARGKSMKGAHTVFAQDADSNAILYTRADILRSEESREVKKFVEYWKSVKGPVDETLVFDCKFTSYAVLGDLAQDNIRFITLRKRHAGLIKKTLELPQDQWQKVYIPIPKRKHKHVSVREDQVTLKGCDKPFRQITVKDHGRSTPTFILTNNEQLSLEDIWEVYAKRWRVENKLSELVSFFNLNALSSPIMVRIHFDIFWTVVADTLYHLLARDLRRFENNLASTLSRKFIDMPGRIVYDGHKFIIKIRKRAHTPVLLDVKKLNTPLEIPWLGGKTIEIVWTP